MYSVQITLKIFIHFVKKKKDGKTINLRRKKNEGAHRMKMRLKIFIKLQRTRFSIPEKLH